LTSLSQSNNGRGAKTDILLVFPFEVEGIDSTSLWIFRSATNTGNQMDMMEALI